MKNENAKHTPGPWRVNQHGNLVDAAMGLNLLKGKKDKDIERANIRLACAAQDLLAACQKRVDEWHEVDSNMDKPEPESLKMARAAIAKATGK